MIKTLRAEISSLFQGKHQPTTSIYYQLITKNMSHNIEQTDKLLNQNSIGQVSVCNCCDKLQVLLGTTMMTLSTQDFEACFASLTKLEQELKTGNPIQTIYLRTPSNAVYIALSQAQFFEAIDLLRGASVLLEINQILH